MVDDQIKVGEEVEASSNPAVRSATSNSLSKRRLLADPKPKQASTTRSPDSSLSSDSSSHQFRKKTRELPNFSDCQGCGVRINYTNPKDRLQNLDSVWRIVLLCKKCMKCVESGQTCSYCFAEASKEKDCFRCRHCERHIHTYCVLKYRKFAPWSYCCPESVFSVCVDCWVPKLLLNSITAHRSSIKKIIPNPCSLGNSRVSVSVDSDGTESLEHVVKDAKSVAEKKVAAAAKAKEIALRRAVAAKRAMELAMNALDLVAKEDEVNAKTVCLGTSSSSTDSASTMVVDDAELASQLHRVINSSSRISKNLCSINSTCLAVPKNGDCRVDISSKLSDSEARCSISVCGKLEICTNCKLIGKLDRVASEPSVCCIRFFNDGSCTELGNSKQEIRTYRRTKLKSVEFQENGKREIMTYRRTKRKSIEFPKNGEREIKIYRRTKLKSRDSLENPEIGLVVGLVGKGSSVHCSGMNSKFQSCQNLDELRPELHLDDSMRNNTVLQDGSCNVKPDRYLLKYSKRLTG